MRFFYAVLVLLFAFSTTNLQAQAGIKGTPGTVTRGDIVNISQTVDDLMPTMRNVNKIHTPGVNQDKDAYFAEKLRIDGILSSLPANTQSGTRATAPTPQRFSSFEGNEPTGVPNDNDIAISPDGMVVSVTNTVFRVYDANGNQLLGRSLTALGGAADTIRNAFDPRALYDFDNDRFIVVYDNGSTPARNNIVVCFSETKDPTGNWFTYALNGNLRPFGIEVWMDYPAIAITKDELFITGNLFTGSATPNSPAVGIWQIDLADGYAGASTVDFATYIDGAIFSLSPCEGSPVTHSPNMHFVTKNSTNGNRVSLYEISNTLGSGQAVFSRLGSYSGDTYSIPPSARQPGSSVNPADGDRLSTNDGRILHAMRANDNVYFVMGSNVDNRPGIYLGKISMGTLAPIFYQYTTQTISSDTLDLGFPSLTYAGQTCEDGPRTKEDIFLGFNYASPNYFPGNGAYYVNIDGDVSAPLLAIEGATNLRLTGSTDDPRNRWGDYTDVATRGESGEAWITGYYVRANGRHATWISQVFVTPDDDCIKVSNDRPSPVVESFKVYPNPTVDYIEFEFNVTEQAVYSAAVMDMQGRVVQQIVKDNLWPGLVKLGFNAAQLPAGRYQVVVEGKDNRVLAKPFVVVK